MRTRLQALALTLLVLCAVTACAAIPTNSTVGKSDPQSPRNNSVNISFQQFAPAAGASQDTIIRGFIDSGTGVSDDFQVAREYLTTSLAQSWAADKRTLVYKNTFTVLPGPVKDSFRVTFDVVSTVDASGVLTPAEGTATVTLDMALVQVDGQWRIAQAPDGVVLTEATFQTLYSPVSLYFYDPTFTYGVPDVRWLVGRTSRTPTAIVRAMLAGPAPYLKGAVVSAFPNGITLERDSVPVNNGLAKVSLTAPPLLETSVRQRQQMHAQLLVTLQKGLNTVTDLQFLAGDRDVDMGGSSDAVPPMVIDNPVPNVQLALSENELVGFDGTTVMALPDIDSIAELAPATPALAYAGGSYAFGTVGGDRLYAVSAGDPARVVVSGTALTPPSFAPNGWLWTAMGDGSGAVIATNVNAEARDSVPVVLRVPWLAGRHVTSLRISHDGTRALVVSDVNGISKVAISGIVKSSEVPTELTAPSYLPHAGNPTQGLWVGESSVAVMAPSATEPVTIEILDLSRAPVPLSELDGVQWMSAGSGVRNVHAQRPNELFSLIGNNWELTGKDLSQASFPG